MPLNYEKVKRIKFSDWLVIAKGKDKIVFTEPRSNKHLTIKVDEQGIIDAHITDETKDKEKEFNDKYESIFRQDLGRLETQLVEIFRGNLKQINLNNPVLDGCFLVIPSENNIQKMFVPKGRNLVLSKEALEGGGGNRPDLLSRIKPQDAETNASTKYLVEKDGKFVGGLIKCHGNYFLLSSAACDIISGVLDVKFGKLKVKFDEVLGPEFR